MKKIVLFSFLTIAILASTGCTDELENAIKENNFSHEISNEYTDQIGVHYIEGIVKNENDKEYSYVQIDFVCYDKDGNNLGTAMDNTNNLGANETWKFKAMGMFTNEKADHCDFKEVTGW